MKGKRTVKRVEECEKGGRIVRREEVVRREGGCEKGGRSVRRKGGV